MKKKAAVYLQSLQNAYSSICGLMMVVTNQEDDRLTQPSGLSEEFGDVLKFAGNSLKNAIPNILTKVKDIQKPIVYETSSGFKLLIAPVVTKQFRPYFILAGILVDENTKEWVEGMVYQSKPLEEHKLWERFLCGARVFTAEHIKRILNQMEELAEIMGMVLEREQDEDHYAYKLQLMNLVRLMDSTSPTWLQGVLTIFNRVMGLEFTGYAANDLDGELFRVTETVGLNEDNAMLGASFYPGEGYLGQVGLTKQMGYWEKSDRDPRASFFTMRGIKPKVIICYPIKYDNQLFGVLFGGSSILPEISEQLADMGMLVANQISSALYALNNEIITERRRIRIGIFQELAQDAVVIKELDTFLQILVKSIHQQIDSTFLCLLLYQQRGGGMDIYTPFKDQADGYSAYAANVEATYFADDRPGVAMLRRPIKRQWEGRSLLEFPIALEHRLLGVIAVHFENERKMKESTMFLNAIHFLVITKMQLETVTVPLTQTAIFNLLHDNLLIWNPEAYNKSAKAKELTVGFLRELNRPNDEVELIGNASVLTEYDPALLTKYFGETPLVIVLRQYQSCREGRSDKERTGIEPYEFLGTVLLIMVWYLEKGGRDWKVTLPVPVKESILRPAELYLSSLAPGAREPRLEIRVQLTAREEEILAHVMHGLNNKEIAEKLFISAHTVKNHITKIYEKLGVSGRVQAISQMYQGPSPEPAPKRQSPK
ncbi:LuxR C-terminal-related transcriptional regulator [Paenibacillus typhae]|uniref:Regulatory protein, luxR family n=1 Tax=Paenibacillus typhae TaxID=1174501 RepID=A0A1G9D3D7_9BACL|nr:LuxR C-terminal-related transcriptional regulator [Paenibacillus typhae]SDK58440.1 regulatory protein, luxR family [Paenibacillus typhae]